MHTKATATPFGMLNLLVHGISLITSSNQRLEQYIHMHFLHVLSNLMAFTTKFD